MVNNDNTINEYQFPHQNNFANNTATNSSNIITTEANDKLVNSSSFFPPLNWNMKYFNMVDKKISNYIKV